MEAHIGFDFPFLPHNLDPFKLIGGSPKHDMHHQKPLTNYQPFFNHLDKMFGTYCPAMSAGGLKRLPGGVGEEAQGDQEAGLREGGRGEREREREGGGGEKKVGGGGGGLVEWEKKHKETKKQG